MVSEVQCDIVRFRAEGMERVGRCESNQGDIGLYKSRLCEKTRRLIVISLTAIDGITLI